MYPWSQVPLNQSFIQVPKTLPHCLCCCVFRASLTISCNVSVTCNVFTLRVHFNILLSFPQYLQCLLELFGILLWTHKPMDVYDNFFFKNKSLRPGNSLNGSMTWCIIYHVNVTSENKCFLQLYYLRFSQICKGRWLEISNETESSCLWHVLVWLTKNQSMCLSQDNCLLSVVAMVWLANQNK